MNKSVAILMCTYNSCRFIGEQLDSLCRQTYTDFDVYIRDDGSKDDTVSVIRDYACKDARLHLLNDITGRGPRDGFLWLLANVTADYYMFCDHDDVWLPTKVEQSVRLMDKQPDVDTTPIIVGSNLKLVDSCLNVIAESYWQVRHYTHGSFNDKYFHLVYNNIPGCVMTINQRAKEVSLPYPDTAAMHDQWIAAAVLWRGGRVELIAEPQMLYRQHESNVVGSRRAPGLISQALNFGSLYRKTKQQHLSCLPLVSMSFATFFLRKVRYLLAFHLSRLTNHAF